MAPAEGDFNNTCAPTLESGPKFHVNERVLCTDTHQVGGTATAKELPPLYEAIIRKSGLKYVDPTSRKILPDRKKSSGRRRQHHHPYQDPEDCDSVQEWCHLVHFQGWNSRWDQWMTETGVFQDTLKNRERVGANSGKIARAPPKSKEDEKKKKRRGRPREVKEIYGEDYEDDADDCSIFQQNLRLVRKACVLPFTLQTILVDDRDKVTKRIYSPPSFNCFESSMEKSSKGIRMLHVLPSTINIIDVLGRFVRAKKQEDLEEFAREQERRREKEEKYQSSLQKFTVSDEDASNGGRHEVSKSTDDRSNNDKKQSVIFTKVILKQKKQKRKQFALSIIALVDIFLPLFLLYKEEREQFEKFIGGGTCDRNSGLLAGVGDDGDTIKQEQATTNKRPSGIYGVEHLLRFFVKLPYILSQYEPKNNKEIGLGVDDEGTDTYILSSEELSQEFAEHVAELIVFLQKNLDCCKGKYFAVE